MFWVYSVSLGSVGPNVGSGSPYQVPRVLGFRVRAQGLGLGIKSWDVPKGSQDPRVVWLQLHKPNWSSARLEEFSMKVFLQLMEEILHHLESLIPRTLGI